MDRDDVAIIGAACLLPDAADLNMFHDNLRYGRDSVGPPSATRIQHTAGTADVDYVPMGYLERVDLFDHQFFGISLGEAELMDPAQRLALQLVHQAIENSGRAPRDLRGSRTAVVFSGTDSGYQRLSEESDPQQILGSVPAALAARISYLFDLVGVALVLDTACSGSLMAVALAVEQLRRGAAELAIAGGVSAHPVLVTRATHLPMRGVESPEGVCRPFDADANGASAGEGGGVVVLKLLSSAVADSDNILAVLKGIAANHNGFRAASMAAPSQSAQTEAIAAAWRDARVDPRTIRYVECHGSGTPLGDVVEVEALRRAFLDAGVDYPHCAIGSVKANVGHLDHAAGMAGLFKAMLSVRHAVLYPTVHFGSPNPLIDFSGPVYVNPATRPWPASTGPRRAGVSSFGLTGTNVHAVVEQPPHPGKPEADPIPAEAPAEAPAEVPAAARPAAELVTVSAKSAPALRRYCQLLADFADVTEHPLRTVAYAMNRGRDDHPYRFTCVEESTAELAAALRSARLTERAAARDPIVVLLFSGDARFDDLSWLDPAVAGVDGNEPGADAARRLAACQHGLFQMVCSLGLTNTRMAGSGVGNLVVRWCRGELSAAQAMHAAGGQQVSADIDQARLEQAAQSFVRDGAVLVEMGSDGVLSRQMHRLAPSLVIVPLVAAGGRRGLLRQVGQVYQLGAMIDWDRHYGDARIPRIEAPTYPFELVRCWCRPVAATMATVPVAATMATVPVAVAAGPVGPAPVEPSADTERRIAAVWERVLKVTGVGSASNYFELGGTSIAGITILRDLEREFGVDLGFATLYQHPTLLELARALDGRRAGAPPVTASPQVGSMAAPPAAPGQPDDLTIPPIPRQGRLPLSYGQEQLWYLDQLSPGTPLYNVPHAIRWRGRLDPVALEGAIRDLADRHEVLRTCVRSDDGVPYAIDAGLRPQLPLVDLRGVPEAERIRQVGRLVAEEAVARIDLHDGPLVRTRLLRLADDDHVLLDTWHHSVFDGWSPVPFFRDLIEFYQARLESRRPRLPELPIQYADFAAWHRSWLSGERLERGLAFWARQLADVPGDELPIDRPRPAAQTYTGDLIEFTIDAELAGRVRAFSRQEGVTTFVTMLAVVDALIFRWAGLADVVVGVGTSGRFNPATHDLIGYFNNVLPFRTVVRGDESFRELVRRCTATVAGVLDHEWVPLQTIVSALCRQRDPARHPLFDIAYTHQNAPSPSISVPEVTLSLFDPEGTSSISGIPPGTAKFDLTLGVTDQVDGPMQAYVEYATDLFKRSTMERLATWLQSLVVSTMDAPDTAVRCLPLPDRAAAGDRRSIPRGTRRWWPEQALAVQMAQAQAASQPNHPAVRCSGRSYTYGEVNRRANRLARRLVQAGVRAEVVVPVIAERDVDLVIAWLAVAKAGGAYVPIDAALPAARIKNIVAEVDPTVAVVSAALAALADAVPRRVEIGTDPDDECAEDADLPPRASAGNLAYVCYTSGSTGRPHGCEVDHGNLANLLRWYRDEGGLGRDDRISQITSPGFDAAVLEVWAGLCSGATIDFVPIECREPGALLRWMAEQAITVAMLPTPLAEVVLTEAILPADLRLRVLLAGGDRLRVRPPAGAGFRLVNIYGPTECTVVSTGGTVQAAAQVGLPDIGRPIANTRVYLLDQHCRPVAPGELGELYVAGAGVGRGYHRLAGVTAGRFVADPFAAEPGARMYRTGDLARLLPDQTIEFCGRTDDQVEIRGNRVEPAEIERALVAHPRVREAVVVPATGPDGSLRLVAYVAGSPPLPAAQDLIAWTEQTLPAYMVPSRVVAQDALPRTPNGKLDRRRMKALVNPMTVGTTTDPADGRVRAERVLGDIWAELLSREQVGPYDNFFELGGDSVMSVRVAARAAKAGIHLSPQQLLRYHTLRELAEATVGSTEVADAVAFDVSGASAGPVGRAAASGPDAELAAASGPMAPTVAAATETQPVDGPIPLTPIMHRFLADLGDRAFDDFVVVLAVETVPGHDGQAVRAAMEYLMAVHEPLRYRFRRNSLGWRIECADTQTDRFVDVQVLPPLDHEQELAVLEADIDLLKSDVDIERGPTMRVRFYDRGPSRGGLVLLVIHHAVFDNMAAIAALDDLDSALAELDAGRPLRVVPRPAVWRAWANHQQAMAVSDELAGELGYWTAILRAGVACGMPGRPDRSGEPGGVVIRTIEPDRAARMLRECGASGEEMMYCALACGLARWRGTPNAYVMTEGKATPNVYRPTSRAPAVGWFTTLHPLLLPVEPGASLRHCLSTVADRIRSVPNDGVGYGILRHLSPHSPAVAQLRALPEPEVLVSHLATDASSFDRGNRQLHNRFDLQLRLKKAATAGFGVVVTSWVHEGALSLGVAYDGRFSADEMTSLADHIVAALAELA